MVAATFRMRPNHDRGSAVALHFRARRLASRGRYRAALWAYRAALRAAERHQVLDPVLLAGLLNDFGVLCKFMGRFAAGERMYRRALRLLSKESSNNKQSVATLYHNLAGVEHARGRCGPALLLARHGLMLRKSAQPRDTGALIDDEAALAAILAGVGRTGEAIKIYRRVLRYYCRSAMPRSRLEQKQSHYEIGSARANLGAVYAQTVRLPVAEMNLRQAVSLLEMALGKHHPRLVSALNNLAVVCARRGRLSEADALYRRAIRLPEIQSRSTHPSTSILRQNYRKLRVLGQPGAETG